ncbi:MAG: hypothetical protein PWP31_396 [Clostridia bacterium]|nr:hypothetical protein [Clostridia bacterium]
MKIGIDINPLVTGHQFRGIGVYTRNLLKAFLDSPICHSYYLYRSLGNFTIPFSKQQVVLHLVNSKEGGLSGLIKKDRVDVLHITDYYHPIYTLADLKQIKKQGTKVVVTIHDVIPLHFPNHYPREKTFIEENVKPLLFFVDKIIANSYATKQDLIKFFSLPSAKVFVTHEGVDHQFFTPIVKDKDSIVLQKYGIKLPYFLYVGGFDWRKNCETILRTYSEFSKKISDKYQLVFVGNDSPTQAMRKIMDKMSEIPIVTGFVPIDDLPPLYRNSAALLFPSYFEGFGLPVLEAMACGTPVLSSNKASLPEIVGDAGILINPDDLNGWVEAMKLLAIDPTLGETLRQKGFARVRTFTWDECARKTWQGYNSCLS